MRELDCRVGVFVSKDQHINRAGKDYLLYGQLLDKAHQCGLRRIATSLMQAPEECNGFVAIVTAQVETERGTFDGIGDASPQNVNRSVGAHLIRMAETRAKARALRDAVNAGEAGLDDLPEDDPDTHSLRRVPAPSGQRRSPTPAEINTHGGVPDPGTTQVDAGPAAATEHQIATIGRLARLLNRPTNVDPGLTAVEASERISELAQAFNDRRKP